jgi:anti-anti-sigma regulatory factor
VGWPARARVDTVASSETATNAKVERMRTLVRIQTSSTGNLVVQVRGVVGPRATAQLRHVLVRAARRTPPARLVIDLRQLTAITPEGVGTVAAGCAIVADRSVAVTVRRPRPAVVRQLCAGGVLPLR